jgi:hypothetical protein
VIQADPEQAEQVLDVCGLQEAHPADEAVWNLSPNEFGFEHPTGMRRANDALDVTQGHAAGKTALNVAGDEIGFGKFRIALDESRSRPRTSDGLQVLAVIEAGFGEQPVRQVQNFLC